MERIGLEISRLSVIISINGLAIVLAIILH